MSGILHLLPVLLLRIALVVHGQPGFINIDCGTPEVFSYKDTVNGFIYTSDTPYIDTGKSHKISPEFLTSDQYDFVKTLRSFPNGGRNCYTLNPITQGKTYLVRAYFMYGNYDGLNILPTFGLYLGTNHWDTISISNASVNYYSEIMVVAPANHLSVCLVDTNTGKPFISALEVRPIGASMYDEVSTLHSLVNYERFNFGAKPGQLLRYPEDSYDRLWGSINPSEWTTLATKSNVVVDNVYRTPLQVMQTAATPVNSSNMNLFFTSSSSIKETRRYHFFMHFAELHSLMADESRKFTIAVNDVDYYQNFVPNILSISTIYNTTTSQNSANELKISLHKSGDSTLPPLINAIEVYIVKQVTYATSSDDVDAIMDIKSFYNVQNNWMGDPCLPKDFVWRGLNCSTESSNAARIISLDLSSSELTGQIMSSLSKLKKLKSLDLSINNLTGGIPDFLGSLQELKFLNLSRSGVSGPVPKVLLDRSEAGFLKLVYSDKSMMQKKDYKNKTNKRVVIIASSVGSAVFLSLLIVGLIVICKRRGKKGDSIPSAGTEVKSKVTSLPSRAINAEHSKFKYAELVRITANFEKKVGKGGFGEVYYGVLENGTPVAVKVLSKESRQGPKEFQAEAKLLSRIHHKSLVRFFGYCVDTELALVYEYMEKGSLADHLSGKASEGYGLCLRQRLSIANDAAQGLRYLHEECTNPIVHRDIKTSNILLSQNFEAKISDFGLSSTCSKESFNQIFTAFMGTLGYLDPACIGFNKPNEKSDVYAFGIVLLELITGQPAIIKKTPENVHIVEWVRPKFDRGQVENVVDPSMQVHNMTSVWRVVETALACTVRDPTERPTMGKIVIVLDECLKLESCGTDGSNNSMSTRKGTSDEILYFNSTFERGPSIRD